MTDASPGSLPATGRTAQRLEIQALRAGAALMVVLYHLWPERLPGGFMGVDVFFVISGFLITAHLAREATSTGGVRLGRFWARRARRLLPAAYLVLATSALAVYIWLPVLDWTQNFKEILASALYFQNWRLAADELDYLAADNAPSVAQHYWTLSVEEQFYIVWPLLVLAAIVLAARLRRATIPTITAVVGATTVASFAYSLYLTSSNGPLAYFHTFTRAWEFGAGALLALLTLRVAGDRRAAGGLDPRVAALVSWAGLGVLAYCAFRLTGDTPFPGAAALLPVLATVAVIAVGVPSSSWGPRWIMQRRFVQWTGDISYPLYLWHWLPIIVLPVALGHGLGFVWRVAILVGTFLAAALTKRFVEDPIRAGRRFGIQRSTVTFACTAVAACALAFTCLSGVQHAEAEADRAEQLLANVESKPPRCFGAASMDPAQPCSNSDLDGVVVPAPEAISRDQIRFPGCLKSIRASTNCQFGQQDDRSVPHVVLLGDSHARAMLTPFAAMAEAGTIRLTAQVKAGCNWSTNPPTTSGEVKQACATWRASLSDWLADHADNIDVVVTAAFAHPRPVTGPDEQVAGVAETWRTMTERGIPVVAIKDNPAHLKRTSECLALLDGPVKPDSCAISRKQGLSNFDPFVEASQQVDGSILYDFSDFYCDESRCPAVIGGVAVYRDLNHITRTYLRTMTPYVEARLDEDGLLVPRKR